MDRRPLTRHLVLVAILGLSVLTACGDDDVDRSATSTSLVEPAPDPVDDDEPVDADGPADDDPVDLGYSGPALPVSTEFDDTGDLAEPWPFDADVDDCGFEAVYGPTATCVVVDGDDTPSPFALVLHELPTRTVAFVGCGDDAAQFPILTIDDGREVGVWQTTETGPTDPAGYVVAALDENWLLVSIVSSDDGIGEDGCPIVYDIGEFTPAVSIGEQHGALRIEDGDIRYCVIEASPGEFLLSDSGFPNDPC